MKRLFGIIVALCLLATPALAGHFGGFHGGGFHGGGFHSFHGGGGFGGWHGGGFHGGGWGGGSWHGGGGWHGGGHGGWYGYGGGYGYAVPYPPNVGTYGPNFHADCGYYQLMYQSTGTLYWYDRWAACLRF